MIDRLIALCLWRRVPVAIIALLAIGYGYYSWSTLSLEAYPDLGDVTAQVTTQVPGLAAEEVEQQITIPLERQLSGTPNLTDMRSSSTFGLSLITLVFNGKAEDYFSRQRITERIAAANLPSAYQPSLDPVSGPAGEIYRYTLESDTRNLMEISELERAQRATDGTGQLGHRAGGSSAWTGQQPGSSHRAADLFLGAA